ncbi:hypothetical protein 2209_scaffold441_00064 [Bacteriophage sp.]|nr:hypothetical protein 2209_scaffold441_00064 [Bacteriophage sp.]
MRGDCHLHGLVGDLGVEDLVVLLEDGLLGCLPLGAVLDGFAGCDVGELVGQQLRPGADRHLGRDADNRRAAVVREYGQTVGWFPFLVLEARDVLRIVFEARVQLPEGEGDDGGRVVHKGRCHRADHLVALQGCIGLTQQRPDFVLLDAVDRGPVQEQVEHFVAPVLHRGRLAHVLGGAFDHVDGLPGQCCVFFHAWLLSQTAERVLPARPFWFTS